MEPISAIASSLALGAGATAGTEVVKSVIKDAYENLKRLIKSRHPQVSFEQLEQAPESQGCRAMIEEDLSKAHADKDLELVAAAYKLTQVIQEQSPNVAAAIGIDLKDVKAASLRLADIAATGTGVRVEKGKFSGDIDIHGVQAGMSLGRSPDQGS